jgi:AcrR family transcriptional regulator
VRVASGTGVVADAAPDATRDTILAAATDLVVSGGLTGFSMDELARRARVSKSSIYRRWPSRDDLIRDVCSQMRDLVADADTGSLVDDLTTLLSRLQEGLSSPTLSAIVIAVIDAAERDDDIAELAAQVSRQSRQVLLRAIRRGIERGELAAGTDPELVVELLVGAVVYRRYFKRVGRSRVEVEALVRTVVTGLA